MRCKVWSVDDANGTAVKQGDKVLYGNRAFNVLLVEEPLHGDHATLLLDGHERGNEWSMGNFVVPVNAVTVVPVGDRNAEMYRQLDESVRFGGDSGWRQAGLNLRAGDYVQSPAHTDRRVYGPAEVLLVERADGELTLHVR